MNIKQIASVLLCIWVFGDVGLYSQIGSISNLPTNYTQPQSGGGIHGDIRTGIGYASIHGDPHLALTFSPQFQIGKLSAAFDIELYFKDQLRFRDDMYDSNPGWLRIIRHIYWGSPSETLHTGVGSLYNINFGSGLLLSNFTNASNYDEREFGFLFDLNYSSSSVEVFINDIFDPEIYGGRFGLAPLANVQAPLINTWEIGVTAVQDTSPNPNGEGTIKHDDTITGIGFDTSLSPIRTNNFLWKIFAQHAFYEDYGSANSLGSSITLPGLTSFLDLELMYEARFVEEKFIAGLFNPTYELHRRRDGIHNLLDGVQEEGANHFIQARMSILDELHFIANYSTPVESDAQGIFNFEANIPDFFEPFAFSASFTKTNMDNFGDVTDIDEHTRIQALADWQMTQLFYLSLLYRAHWRETSSTTKHYDKQETVSPQLSFRYAF
jgi:hypothetical protein